RRNSTGIERDSLPPLTPDVIIDRQIADNNRSSYPSRFNNMSSDALSIITLDDYDDDGYSISEARSYEDLLGAKHRNYDH
ncbi:8833_t:CDS:2, partial [Paraglomus occultum]